MPKSPQVKIYTDGGCKPNPGAGGWGAVILGKSRKPKDLWGSAEQTTNNRMELQAVIEALRFLNSPTQATITTDSTYVKNGVTKWMESWKKRGWLTQNKLPVKNKDLWETLDQEMKRHRLTWKWTKGHAGNRWNNRADELATRGRTESRPEVELETEADSVRIVTEVTFQGSQSTGKWSSHLSYKGKSKVITGDEAKTTPNQLHIKAAIGGLLQLKRSLPIHLYTPSDYLVDGATQWMQKWRERSWLTIAGKPVANRESWEELAALLERYSVTWHVAKREELQKLIEDSKRPSREIPMI